MTKRTALLLIAFFVLFAVAAAPKETARSGSWPTLEKHYKADHPTCIYCDNPTEQIHHVCPFHDDPSLELDDNNLAALCHEHHGENAHLGFHYKSWNPLIREEAALHRAMVAARPTTDKEAAAFVKRFKKCFDPQNYQSAP